MHEQQDKVQKEARALQNTNRSPADAYACESVRPQPYFHVILQNMLKLVVFNSPLACRAHANMQHQSLKHYIAQGNWTHIDSSCAKSELVS